MSKTVLPLNCCSDVKVCQNTFVIFVCVLWTNADDATRCRGKHKTLSVIFESSSFHYFIFTVVLQTLYLHTKKNMNSNNQALISTNFCSSSYDRFHHYWNGSISNSLLQAVLFTFSLCLSVVGQPSSFRFVVIRGHTFVCLFRFDGIKLHLSRGCNSRVKKFKEVVPSET